jgi:hypothetical protein
MRIEDLKDTQILSIHNVIKIMKETIFIIAVLSEREMLNYKQI